MINAMIEFSKLIWSLFFVILGLAMLITLIFVIIGTAQELKERSKK